MKAQEALVLLNDMEFADKYQGKEEYTDMLLLCKDALKKQIPRKPIAKDTTAYDGSLIDVVFVCPECNRAVCYESEADIEERYPHCNCGQALDWSDTE